MTKLNKGVKGGKMGNLDKSEDVNSTRPTADTLCVCLFPTLSQNIYGKCDVCGGCFFDTRVLLPLQTVCSHQPLASESYRVIPNDYNKLALERNNRIAAGEFKELRRLSAVGDKAVSQDKPSKIAPPNPIKIGDEDHGDSE